MNYLRRIFWSARTLAICLCCMMATGYAQDSLRIIELSGPGQSAPVNVPAGHAFTFSLFSPESGSTDPEAAVGVVRYSAPISYSYERRAMIGQQDQWFLGPAQIVLKGSSAGARMQLYTFKFPPGIVSGILTANAPTHSATVPKDSLLTCMLAYTADSGGTFPPLRPFSNFLSIKRPNGVVYSMSRLPYYSFIYIHGNPRVGGSAMLHNPNSPASQVVAGFYYDDLDSVSPTADFVGPGTATFSLPPEGERGTPIAFYCYRITPANITGADATPPVVKVTTPKTASASTGASSYLLKGSVTDNINATRIRFRVRPPNASAYGNWASVNLGGNSKTKSWHRAISLSRKGTWRVQVQALDGEQNASTVQTITLTRQ